MEEKRTTYVRWRPGERHGCCTEMLGSDWIIQAPETDNSRVKYFQYCSTLTIKINNMVSQSRKKKRQQQS